MHGVPHHLPLHLFHRAQLRAIEPLGNICYFVFERAHRKCGQAPRISVGVEGLWQLTHPIAPPASGQPIPDAAAHVLALNLVGQRASGSALHSPRSFSLQFASGHTLEVFDSNADYESFCIPEANVYV